jgi:hypothetical protein
MVERFWEHSEQGTNGLVWHAPAVGSVIHLVAHPQCESGNHPVRAAKLTTICYANE